jgi:polyferredoxin
MAQQRPTRDLLRRVWRPRVLIYASLLLLCGTGFALSLALRHDFAVDVIRDRGALARPVGQGRIENTYRLQVMNSTEAQQDFRLEVEGLPGLAWPASPR